MARLQARPRELDVDPECLRWTPVVVTNTVVSDADADDDDEDEEEDDEPEENNRKEVNVSFADKWLCCSQLLSYLLPFLFIYLYSGPFVCIHQIKILSCHNGTEKFFVFVVALS